MVEESWSSFYKEALAKSKEGTPATDIAYKGIYAMNKEEARKKTGYGGKRLALDALAIRVKATSTQITIEGEIPLKFSSTAQTWA
jgi:hypothetical protein